MKETIEKNKDKINLIENSNIDFTKLGWCMKVGLIIKCPTQKVKVWMERNMPDFYKAKCYMRKSSKHFVRESADISKETLNENDKVVE